MKSNFPSSEKLCYYIYLDWINNKPVFILKVESHIAEYFINELLQITTAELNGLTDYKFNEKELKRVAKLDGEFGWLSGIRWSGKNFETHEFTIHVSRHDPKRTLVNLSLMFTLLNRAENVSQADYLQPLWINMKTSGDLLISGFVLPHTGSQFVEWHKSENRQLIEKVQDFAQYLCESHAETDHIKVNYQNFEIGGIGYHAALVPSENIELGKGFTFNSKNVDRPDQALILLVCLMEMTQFEYLPRRFEVIY